MAKEKIYSKRIYNYILNYIYIKAVTASLTTDFMLKLNFLGAFGCDLQVTAVQFVQLSKVV